MMSNHKSELQDVSWPKLILFDNSQQYFKE